MCTDVEKLVLAASERETDTCRELWLVVGDAIDVGTYRRRAQVTCVC